MGRVKGKRRLVLLSVATVMAAAISGCAFSGFGGGTIGSADGVPGDHAVFSINYRITSYNPTTAIGTGRLTGVYIDNHPGGGRGAVRLKFNNLLFGLGTCADLVRVYGGFLPGIPNPCLIFGAAADKCFAGVGGYTSINPAFPGSGQVGVLGCDAGRPGSATSPDLLAVSVLSGPYGGPTMGSGYTNGPKPVTGNLTTR